MKIIDNSKFFNQFRLSYLSKEMKNNRKAPISNLEIENFIELNVGMYSNYIKSLEDVCDQLKSVNSKSHDMSKISSFRMIQENITYMLKNIARLHISEMSKNSWKAINFSDQLISVYKEITPEYIVPDVVIKNIEFINEKAKEYNNLNKFSAREEFLPVENTIEYSEKEGFLRLFNVYKSFFAENNYQTDYLISSDGRYNRKSLLRSSNMKANLGAFLDFVELSDSFWLKYIKNYYSDTFSDSGYLTVPADTVQTTFACLYAYMENDSKVSANFFSHIIDNDSVLFPYISNRYINPKDDTVVNLFKEVGNFSGNNININLDNALKFINNTTPTFKIQD